MTILSRLFSWILARVGFDAGGDVTAADLELHDIRRGIPRFASEKPRSPEWPAFRRKMLAKMGDYCWYCNGKIDIQLHHRMPFHVQPLLELDPENVVPLCEAPGLDCHLKHGHNGNFQNYNPNIMEECLAQQRTWKNNPV